MKPEQKIRIDDDSQEAIAVYVGTTIVGYISYDTDASDVLDLIEAIKQKQEQLED